MDGLRNHETVVVVLKRGLSAAESICHALFDSGFIGNMVRFPSKYQLVFLNYREISPENGENLHIMLRGEKKGLAKIKGENARFEKSSRDALKKSLQEYLENASTDLRNSLSDAELETLLSKTVITLTAFQHYTHQFYATKNSNTDSTPVMIVKMLTTLLNR